MRIRIAEEDDAARIRAIYGPSVTDDATSFETELPGEATLRERIRNTQTRYPWLVAEREGLVCGFAYAGPHRGRSAYRWAVEVSIYVDEAHRRGGVARRLYQRLFDILDEQGFHKAYAGITLPNPASRSLHESLGFRQLAVYPQIGFKQGRWHDVGWWELTLREPTDEAPSEPVPFAAIRSRLETKLDT